MALALRVDMAMSPLERKAFRPFKARNTTRHKSWSRAYDGWGTRAGQRRPGVTQPDLEYESPAWTALVSAPLTPLQLSVARRLASGQTKVKAAEETGVDLNAISFWCRWVPGFTQQLRNLAIEHEEAVRETLLAGEVKAGETLVQALGAETDRGKPMWQTRVTAAIELLNRAGVRGKPVERQAVMATHVSEGSTREALSKVLADPGVREWLKSAHPQAVAQIAAGVSAPDAEAVPDVEIEPIEEAV